MHNAPSYTTQIGITQRNKILAEKSKLSYPKSAFIEVIF